MPLFVIRHFYSVHILSVVEYSQCVRFMQLNVKIICEAMRKAYVDEGSFLSILKTKALVWILWLE